MSGIFVIDREDGPWGAEAEMWDAPRGVFFWAVETIAERVRDEELAALLREFLAGGYGWLALTCYTPEQATEIVRVIREELRSAADAGLREIVDDLVAIADRWTSGTLVSATVRLDRPGGKRDDVPQWDATAADVDWVRGVLSRHVASPALATKLAAHPLKAPDWLSFKEFSDDEVDEMLAVILAEHESLPALADLAAEWDAVSRP
ncbi:hypothetical protein LFM09_02290 [Lentzea alba]|uniref:hypothetical protein n=1 Tax=Lentzea alba TaxID=2714351 RepID=UPI0039BED978